MQFACPIGSACPDGLALKCQGAEYTSRYFLDLLKAILKNFFSENRENCEICPERYYCEDGFINKCPTGQYCVGGVSAGTNCPVGFWSNVELLANADECMICPGNILFLLKSNFIEILTIGNN